MLFPWSKLFPLYSGSCWRQDFDICMFKTVRDASELWNVISITATGQSISISIIAFCLTMRFRNDSVHGKRQPSPSLWVKKTQFDKQLVADIVWWCYQAQNRSPLWGAAYKWGLKIFFSSLFCGLLFSRQMRKWFAAGYSGGIPSTFFFFPPRVKLHP